MGNCLKKKQRRNIVLLLIGLDNAGKTVTVKGLAGENQEDSVPTVGFSTISLKYLDTHVTVYDLGGGKDIRGIWPTYFVDAHGVIFVIDSSDFIRLDEAKSVLHSVLSHEKITGKPILLLANKQDSDDALDELDLAEKLELEKLVNEQKCPTLIESCSAQQKRKKIDPGIKNGYKWLLNSILREFDNINARVHRDIYEQQIETREKRKNIIRVNTLFENNPIEVNGDPFKPIGDIVKKNNKKRRKVERNDSATSSKSYLVTKKQVKSNRPKSAVDIVKRQLVKSKRRNTTFILPSNKTTPVNLFTPKREKAVTTIVSNEPIYNVFEKNTSHNGTILTAKNLANSDTTELPNSSDTRNFISEKKLEKLSGTVSDAPNFSSEKNIHQNGISRVTDLSVSDAPNFSPEKITKTIALSNSLKTVSDAPNVPTGKIIHPNGLMGPLRVTELSNTASDVTNFSSGKNIRQNGVSVKTVMDAMDFHDKIQQNGVSELPSSTRTVTVLPNSTSVVVETHVELFAVNNFKPQVKNLTFRDEKSTKRKNIQEDFDIILKDIS